MRLQTFFIGSTVLAFSILLILIMGMLVRETFLQSQGYYTGVTGPEMAHMIQEKGLNPSTCSKIDNWPELLAPSSEEQRAGCYFELARLLQDPTLCEPLMPSDYGMRCLAEVNTEHSKEANEPACYKENGYLKCVDATTGKLLIASLYNQITDCTLYAKGKTRDVCYSERSSTFPDVNDCHLIEDSRTKMYCAVGIALKKKDPMLCDVVQDEWAKRHCKLTIALWQKYPKYRCQLIPDAGCSAN